MSWTPIDWLWTMQKSYFGNGNNEETVQPKPIQDVPATTHVNVDYTNIIALHSPAINKLENQPLSDGDEETVKPIQEVQAPTDVNIRDTKIIVVLPVDKRENQVLPHADETITIIDPTDTETDDPSVNGYLAGETFFDNSSDLPEPIILYIHPEEPRIRLHEDNSIDSDSEIIEQVFNANVPNQTQSGLEDANLSSSNTWSRGFDNGSDNEFDEVKMNDETLPDKPEVLHFDHEVPEPHIQDVVLSNTNKEMPTTSALLDSQCFDLKHQSPVSQLPQCSPIMSIGSSVLNSKPSPQPQSTPESVVHDKLTLFNGPPVCSELFCRLGCICSSLNYKKPERLCKRIKCMLSDSCTCIHGANINVKNTLIENGHTLSRLRPRTPRKTFKRRYVEELERTLKRKTQKMN